MSYSPVFCTGCKRIGGKTVFSFKDVNGNQVGYDESTLMTMLDDCGRIFFDVAVRGVAGNSGSDCYRQRYEKTDAVLNSISETFNFNCGDALVYIEKQNLVAGVLLTHKEEFYLRYKHALLPKYRQYKLVGKGNKFRHFSNRLAWLTLVNKYLVEASRQQSDFAPLKGSSITLMYLGCPAKMFKGDKLHRDWVVEVDYLLLRVTSKTHIMWFALELNSKSKRVRIARINIDFAPDLVLYAVRSLILNKDWREMKQECCDNYFFTELFGIVIENMRGGSDEKLSI